MTIGSIYVKRDSPQEKVEVIYYNYGIVEYVYMEERNLWGQLGHAATNKEDFVSQFMPMNKFFEYLYILDNE